MLVLISRTGGKMSDAPDIWYIPPRYEARCVCGGFEDITQYGRVSDAFVRTHGSHQTPDIEMPIDLVVIYPEHPREER